MSEGRGTQESLATALRLLKTAERTVAELRAALLPKYAETDVDATLAWLAARNLLSDDRVAEATMRLRTAERRAEGDQKLRQRLEAKGADDNAIQRALTDAPDEATRMRHALAAKFRPEAHERAKAGRFLLSRGFEEDAIDGALDRFFGETDVQ